MSLQQLSTKGQASDYGYENTPGHRSTGPGDVELAHVDAVGANIYDSFQRGDKDEHTYNVAGKVRASSEVTLSRRSAIILVVSGVILSAVISIITGVVVNHVTNGKMTQTDPEVNISHQLDALEQIQVDVSKRQTILEQTQASTTRELEKLEQTQANTIRELDNLAKTQINTTRELDNLAKTQINTTQKLDNLAKPQINTTRELDNLAKTQFNTTRELESIRVELYALENSQVETSSDIETLTAGQNATKHQLEILEDKLNSSGLHVAFSVFSPSADLIPDRRPAYIHTVTNTGHYNIASGEFTCPVAGLYYFSLSIQHDGTSSDETLCFFRVNGHGGVYVGKRQGTYELASGSVIEHLSVNDVVSLDCRGWQHVYTLGASYSNAVFSGFLISPD